MNAAAKITNDDGDNVNHGWSQLDIAKHSTNTFVASLEDSDYISIVTYSDAASVGLALEQTWALAPAISPAASTSIFFPVAGSC